MAYFNDVWALQLSEYADFTGTPLTGVGNLTVLFTDLSIGATSWFWDFGDGGTSTEQNPAHVYTVAGHFTVSLTINGTTTETKSDYVQVYTTCDFFANPTRGTANLRVRFTNLSTVTVTSYLWSFGDGDTSTEQNPTHVYKVPGTYTVVLALNGGAYSETKTDYVIVLPRDSFGKSFVSNFQVTSPTISGTEMDQELLRKVNRRTVIVYKQEVQ